MVWCILGLGNPGEAYRSTRHNVGFDLIDLLSARWNIPVTIQGPSFLFGSGDWKDTPVLLVKPMTFMNRSGVAYSRLLKDPAITREKTLVVLDDFNLPLGKIRIRRKGSDGGHNGFVRSWKRRGRTKSPACVWALGERTKIGSNSCCSHFPPRNGK